MTERALMALRPLIGAATAEGLHAVVRNLAAELQALRYTLAIVERGAEVHTVHWLCEDEDAWWEDLRLDHRRFLATPGARGALRSLRFAVDGNHSAAQRILRRRQGRIIHTTVAETRQPANMLACLGLMFGDSVMGSQAAQRQLTVLGHHAAALMLDAWLALPPVKPDGPRLSVRESECLRWAAAGKTSWETACILGVRERTVNFHLGNVFGKLRVNNKQAAVAQAISQGLLSL